LSLKSKGTLSTTYTITMYLPRSNAKRILFWMALVGLFPFFVLAIPEYYFAKTAISDSVEDHLYSTIESQAAHIDDWLRSIKKDLIFISQSNCMQGLCSGSCATKVSPSACPFFDAVLKSHPSYRNITSYTNNWLVISRGGKTGKCQEEGPLNNFKQQLSSSKEIIISEELCWEEGHSILQVGLPMSSPKSDIHSYLIAYLDLKAALSPITERIFQKKSEKVYLLTTEGQYLYPPAGFPELLGKQSGLPLSFLQKEENIKEYPDFRGIQVLGTSLPIQETNWRLVVEIDKNAAFHWLNSFNILTGIVFLLTLIIVIFVSFIVSKKLSLPLQKLSAVAQKISKGNHWERVPQFKEREAREVGVAFNTMLDKLNTNYRTMIKSASLSAIGELSTSLVHEIRRPLTSIKLNLQTLLDHEFTSPDHQKLANISLDQSLRIETLIDELLNYGKPIQLHMEKISFKELITRVMQSLPEEIQEKKLQINIEDKLGDQKFLIDKERIVLVLLNLIENAAYWSPHGGVIIIKGQPALENPGWVSLCVRDNGPGVAKENRSKIFQPFYTTRENGTGLGLPNAQKIINYHNGTFFVEPNPKGGALFSFQLPIEECCFEQDSNN
jgi:signal transduction histidine kinase